MRFARSVGMLGNFTLSEVDLFGQVPAKLAPYPASSLMPNGRHQTSESESNLSSRFR